MTSTSDTTSASPSTSNDSHMQDNNGASEMSIDQPQSQHHQQQQHQSPEKPHQQRHKQQPPQPHQQQQQQQQQSSKHQQQPPQTNTIEQKRPMNAFLLFCKKQRSLVREKYPNLENRGITRILGDWWSKLDKEQKSKYTNLARQHKEAFMEANPDFKWCKTTNNNNNSSNSTNTNNDDCYATNNRSSTQESSSLSPASTDLHQSNSRDATTATTPSITTNNRQHQQNEAPKPPKKRYLERNDPVYSSKNNSSSKHEQETNSNAKDQIVPYMQLDQATLGRVIEKALSEKSNDSPAGLNMCKDSNRNYSSNNLTSSIGVESNLFTTPTTTIATSAPTTTTSTSLYSNGNDEPVDFSMKVTFRATNQVIIDSVVEKAYSGLIDISSGSSRSGGTSNVHSQLGHPIGRVNTEET